MPEFNESEEQATLDDEELAFDNDFSDSGLEDTLEGTSLDSGIVANFDVISIISTLGKHNLPARIDIHTFAYLACLMSVYHGLPATDWGYSFSAVPPTLPYSPTLDAAIDELIEAQLVELAGPDDLIDVPEYRVTAAGTAELSFLSGLRLLSARLPYLEASTSAAIFTSSAAVVNSLANESQLAAATKVRSSRSLLSSGSSTKLYEEFHALSRAISEPDANLIVPASMYVQYLQDVGRDAIDNSITLQVTRA